MENTDQSALIEQLRERIAKLEAENADLRAKLDRKGTGRPALGVAPLTNTEKQRRKRARIKARAAGLPDPFAKEADSADS